MAPPSTKKQKLSDSQIKDLEVFILSELEHDSDYKRPGASSNIVGVYLNFGTALKARKKSKYDKIVEFVEDSVIGETKEETEESKQDVPFISERIFTKDNHIIKFDDIEEDILDEILDSEEMFESPAYIEWEISNHKIIV